MPVGINIQLTDEQNANLEMLCEVLDMTKKQALGLCADLGCSVVSNKYNLSLFELSLVSRIILAQNPAKKSLPRRK